MSPLAKNAFACGQRRLELASRLIEEAADSGHQSLIGAAYAEILIARGEIAAAIQLIDLEDTLAMPDSERPAHLPPRLMLVRK